MRDNTRERDREYNLERDNAEIFSIGMEIWRDEEMTI